MIKRKHLASLETAKNILKENFPFIANDLNQLLIVLQKYKKRSYIEIDTEQQNNDFNDENGNWNVDFNSKISGLPG